MPLIKNNGDIIEDKFRILNDDETLPEGAPVIVSLERWQRDRETLIQRNAPLGLKLTSAQSPVGLSDDVNRFALIAIEFPSFRDGRGFSYARRLREQLGFKGELRAIGHLIPDQAQFARRCGFDTIDVKDDANLASWKRGFSEFTVFYQTAADRVASVFARRHQRRAAE